MAATKPKLPFLQFKVGKQFYDLTEINKQQFNSSTEVNVYYNANSGRVLVAVISFKQLTNIVNK